MGIFLTCYMIDKAVLRRKGALTKLLLTIRTTLLKWWEFTIQNVLWRKSKQKENQRVNYLIDYNKSIRVVCSEINDDALQMRTYLYKQGQKNLFTHVLKCYGTYENSSFALKCDSFLHFSFPNLLTLCRNIFLLMRQTNIEI